MLNSVDSGWYSLYDNWDKGLWFIIAEKSVGIYGILGENTIKTRLIQRYFVQKPVDFEETGNFGQFRSKMSAVIMSPAVEIIQPPKEKDNDIDHMTDEPVSQESIKTQNSQKSQVSQNSQDSQCSQESWTNISKMMAGKVV